MSALVLALNPSIDAEWRVADALWEEKNVVQSERRWAGGKGVNVARWLKHLDGAPKLLLPLGGITGKELAAHLRREHLSAAVVNVIITTAERRQLRFNPPGPELSAAEWRRILRDPTIVEASLLLGAFRQSAARSEGGSLCGAYPVGATRRCENDFGL